MKAIAALAASIAMMLSGGTAYASTDTSYLSVLNQERASRGLPPLHVSEDLVRVAQEWSDEMARSRVLQHNPRLASDVHNWWSVGENVGVGADLSDLAQAFWNSPEHRANILDAHYTDVGIATATSAHRIWITVVFRQAWHHVTHHAVSLRRRAPHPRAVAPKADPPLLLRGLWFAWRWTLR